jgi:hypothetical protein
MLEKNNNKSAQKHLPLYQVRLNTYNICRLG